MPTAPSSRVTSHMSADIIIGCTISTGGPGGFAPGRVSGGKYRRSRYIGTLSTIWNGDGTRAGLQAAVAQHFQAVLRGGHKPSHWPRDRREVHHRSLPFVTPDPPIADVIMAQGPNIIGG